MDEEIKEHGEIASRLNSRVEWLVVRDNGTSAPIIVREASIETQGGRTRFGFCGEHGYVYFALRSCRANGDELLLDVSTQFARSSETIRLVPRTSAGELAANVITARLEQAGRIANATAKTFEALRLKRVALNAGSGRFAEIILGEKSGGQIALLSDVTDSVSAECLLASGMLWIDRLRIRSRKRFSQLWLAAPRKQARQLQKLVAMMRPGALADIRILILDLKKDVPCTELKSLNLSDLWRETPRQLVLPATAATSAAAGRIISSSPDDIDVVNSKQGETLRFRGLAFARVRNMLGREKAWFGVERERRPLTEDSRADLAELIRNLAEYRIAETGNRRHRFYTLSPEAWLESLLRRNIKLLDANLILSPLYNQFRAMNDKIDLLALRRDGRLVIIELKTSPDREMVFQAADYWRKIEMQRRRGNLAKAKVFGDMQILDKPALVYAVAPALSFHRDFEYFARKLAPEIDLWRFELHENWRAEIKVIARKCYNGGDQDGALPLTNL